MGMIHGPKHLEIRFQVFSAIKKRTAKSLLTKKIVRRTRKRNQKRKRKRKKKKKKEKEEKKRKEAEKKKEKPKEPKIIQIKEPLQFETNIVESIGFSKDLFNSSKEKLHKLDEIDRIKHERETSLNDLESFILNIR